MRVRSSRIGTIRASALSFAIIDKVEGQLGRLTQQFFNTLRVFNTRQLDHDPAVAFALDNRFGRATAVQAAVDDFNRARNRLVANPLQGAFVEYTFNRSFVFNRCDQPAIEPAHQRLGIAHLRRILEGNRQAIRQTVDRAESDFLIAQFTGQRRCKIFPGLLDHRIDIDFEQQVRPTLQVKTETNGARGHP